MNKLKFVQEEFSQLFESLDPDNLGSWDVLSA